MRLDDPDASVRARAVLWRDAVARPHAPAAWRVAEWLGMDPQQLTDVPPAFVAAIAARLDEATAWIPGLRDELLEHTRDRVALFEHEANVDVLTGIANRRALEERLDTEMRRSRRYRRPLCLLIIDVDGLKQVNDTLGHAAGDTYLVTVAQRLLATVRRTDLVGRWGGDEFAIICPETGPKASARLRRKLVEAVEGAPFVLPGGDRAGSVSIGCACAHDPWDPEGLVREADATLYWDKQRRREQAAARERQRARR